MAVVAMDKISVYGNLKNRKKALEAMQRIGVVDVSPVNIIDGLEGIDTVKNRVVFEKTIDTVNEALEILDKYSPDDKGIFASFEGREVISVDEYYKSVSESDLRLNDAKKIIQLEREKIDVLAEIQRRKNQIISLEPWRTLGIPMTFEGTKKTSFFTGVFSGEVDIDKVLVDFYSDELFNSVEISIINRDKERIYIAVICKKDEKNIVEQRLRSFGFSLPTIVTSMVPLARIERNHGKIAVLEEKIRKIEKQIKDMSTYRDNLKFIYDYYLMRIEKYKVIENTAKTKSAFILSGFIPHECVEEITLFLWKEAEAVVEIEEITDDDTPPVLLKNNSFSAPVEGVLESYSLPGRGEIDPTSVMSVFYYVLFGLMLSDAAYGLIMFFGCAAVLKKFKNMEIGLRKSLTMFMYCGISTAFWGVMFGSYFGDAFTVIGQTFFNKDFTIPALWFVPVNEPMRMLMFSMLLGIIHLFGGLAMKLYSCIKAKDYQSAFYDVVCWYFTVGGLIVYLLSVPMFKDMTGLSFTLPKTVGNIAIVFAVIGALGIILFSARTTKSPGKRVAKGLYELYGITSYLSDILSYSRLLALGLATGVIASVFNKMGSMLGDGIVGAILFTIVFLIGHSLNMAINLLGAYVHTNRLQFVEFFGKFYEGGGEKYSPFAVNTKYFKIKEEI